MVTPFELGGYDPELIELAAGDDVDALDGDEEVFVVLVVELLVFDLGGLVEDRFAEEVFDDDDDEEIDDDADDDVDDEDASNDGADVLEADLAVEAVVEFAVIGFGCELP